MLQPMKNAGRWKAEAPALQNLPKYGKRKKSRRDHVNTRHAPWEHE